MTRIFEIAKINNSALLTQLHEAGIEAVSKERWSRLQSTAQLIDQTEFSTLKVREQIDRLKQRSPNSAFEGFNPQSYRDVIHWSRLIQPTYQKWQQEQINFFNDPLWWQRCSNKIDMLPPEQQSTAYLTLEHLQETWRSQGAYAHYSTLDIIHVYQTVMPIFSEWLHDAKTELQKRPTALPAQLQAYQHYLVWFETALAEEQALLRTCLQGRLAIGLQKGHGAHDNVIDAMRDKLKAIHILHEEPKLDRTLAHGYVTPDAFVTIRKMIEQDGSEKEKAAFYALGYHQNCQFDNPSLFHHHYRQDLQGCTYFIPPARSDMIPTKPPFYLQLPRFLQQLFWGDMVVYTFFQHTDCQFLLAQNAAGLATRVDASSIQLDGLFESPVWQESHLCLRLCRAEYARTTHWLDHILLFLFPSIKALLQGYRNDLQRDAEAWATRQLQMLTERIKASSDRILTKEQKNVVTAAWVSLEQAHQQWHFSADFMSQLTEAKHYYTDESHEESIVPAPAVTMPAPSLPARNAFPLALKRVVQLMARTDTLPADKLSALETQLQIDAGTYDSVALRCWLVDYLTNTPDLPRNLVAGLQAVLDEPQFSAKALEREETKALRVFNKSLVDSVTALTRKETLETSPLWEEDPWHYPEDKFQAHCQALKQYAAQLPQGLSVSENEKLCQYTLRFFKQMYTLTDWADFVLKQDRVKALLATLIEVSKTCFSVLTPSLSAVASAEKTIYAAEWGGFINKTLLLRIEILETFINRSQLMPSIHHDGVFCSSQNKIHEGKAEESVSLPSLTLTKTY